MSDCKFIVEQLGVALNTGHTLILGWGPSLHRSFVKQARGQDISFFGAGTFGISFDSNHRMFSI